MRGFVRGFSDTFLNVVGNLTNDNRQTSIMSKKTLALELIQQIVHPAMNNFSENEMIETVLPSFATKKTEFECLLLNCIMVMTVTERRDKQKFKEEGLFNEFTLACLVYNEEEKLYMPEKDTFDEDIATKELFEKWNNYEHALSKLAKTGDNSEIAEMIFKPQFGMQRVVMEMALNKKKLEISMIQTIVLINEKLPELISSY